ncbi:carboxypeptidase-like regulatory domain-containing protein [Mucilaginibacter sp. ZT4R22]|uniref:Carboxypeptidase-like regulatory domain-containing protein n=1 Tax=Mucilaginibacter pankratovii TaxID=2772110 RepID=A0ABR7WSF5_9SPHI|nr:carboxypeptidase-like regulatory domain-containing protein [Mucilaginibacter pankratovii]MBD1365240.1 carboxypeptidase-like regulatory domain-containing protein [Mucilaginibacter pankratovii]
MHILSAKHLPILLSVIFICLVFTVRGQNSISGTVRDDKGETLPGVTVFLSGTKAITAADNNGKFSLKNVAPGSYTLTARFVGFQTFTLAITIAKDVTVNIKLQPSVSSLSEVKITAYSEEYYQKFRQYFLGTTLNAEKCTILNKEALHFHFDKASNTLTVTADDFLEIENKALGYKIKYLLQSFRLNEEEKLLAYQGQSVFEDLKAETPKEAKTWKQNREIAYQGSIYHFLRSVYKGTLQKDGYAVYTILNKTVPGSTDDGAQMRPDRKPLKADSLMKVIDADVKYFNHKQSLFVVYTIYEPEAYSNTGGGYDVKMTTKWNTFPKGQYSVLSFLVPEIVVDKHGYYSPPGSLAVEGRMAWEQIADLNPMEYGN